MFPAKTNVHFLQVINQHTLEIRVWERGAGPTLACGTGACATLVAARLLGLSESEATVNLPGGPLEINWPDPEGSVFMTGRNRRIELKVITEILANSLDGLVNGPTYVTV